jgi:hypothetical protein
MKTNGFCHPRCLIRVTSLSLFVSASVSAAPLTWFPGIALKEPRSSAATAAAPGGGGILLFGGNPIGSTNVLAYGGNDAQPLYSTRVAPGAVAINVGQYYVFGGRSTNTARSASSSVYSYSPVAAGPDAENPTLFSVSPMITARSDMAYSGDSAGYVYAIGGLGRNTNALASVERYDRVADSWTNMAALPVATYQFGAAFDGTNTIYVFGGRTNGTTGGEVSTVFSYDIGGNVWSTQEPMLIATAGGAAVKGSDGKFYLIGGTTGSVVTNLVQVYDPGSGTWSLSTPLPAPVSAAGAAVDGLGRLVVMGGADAYNVDQNTTWVSQQLNIADSVPVFTSYPRLNANCSIPYTYAAQASGNPQATYQLISAPTGMQIDLYSGLVTWTPDASEFGSNFVAIVAGNYAGSATQTFTIKTVGPPLAPPTNLVEAAVSDTSVTISWGPTAYLIGPLTYSVYQRTFVHDPKGSGGGYVYGLIAGNLTTNSVTISGLGVGSGHTYVVEAFAAGVSSGYSSAISIVTTAPQPPQNLRLTELTSTTTALAWDPSPGPIPIVYYTLFDYGSSYPAYPVAGATQITNTSADLTGLVPGSSHLYYVLAYDAAGNASSLGGLGATELAVVNPIPTPPTVSAVAASPGAPFQFTVQLTSGIQTSVIQATTNPGDPTSWATIATNPPGSGSYVFTDPDSGLYPARFYRVLIQ